MRNTSEPVRDTRYAVVIDAPTLEQAEVVAFHATSSDAGIDLAERLHPQLLVSGAVVPVTLAEASAEGFIPAARRKFEEASRG